MKIDLNKYAAAKGSSDLSIGLGLRTRSYNAFVDEHLSDLPDGVTLRSITSKYGWRTYIWRGIQITGGGYKDPLRRKVMIKDGTIDLAKLKAKIAECAEHAAKVAEAEAIATAKMNQKKQARKTVEAWIKSQTDRVRIHRFEDAEHMSVIVDIESASELNAVIEAINRLLTDPHPGLISWGLLLGAEMNALCEMWQQDKDAAPINTESVNEDD